MSFFYSVETPEIPLKFLGRKKNELKPRPRSISMVKTTLIMVARDSLFTRYDCRYLPFHRFSKKRLLQGLLCHNKDSFSGSIGQPKVFGRRYRRAKGRGLEGFVCICNPKKGELILLETDNFDIVLNGET